MMIPLLKPVFIRGTLHLRQILTENQIWWKIILSKIAMYKEGKQSKRTTCHQPKQIQRWRERILQTIIISNHLLHKLSQNPLLQDQNKKRKPRNPNNVV